MIQANLATYPPRLSNLENVVRALNPQVDRLNVVLNQFEDVPAFLSDYDKVVPIIPDEDTKDVGKFYPSSEEATYVFFVDDDVVYPAEYIAQSVAAFEKLQNPRSFAGYHCSTYVRPKFSLTPQGARNYFRLVVKPRKIDGYRHFIHFGTTTDRFVLVDQVATNASMMRGSDMPPYAYMRDSQKFVDVRIAKFCFENGIDRVSLPRQKSWLSEVPFEETIVHGFTTTSPAHVGREIWEYAFKDKRVGSDAPIHA